MSELEDILTLGKAASSSTTVTIVASLKERGEPHDFDDIQTEYFSERELEEITSGFREAGYLTDSFTDEFEFIKWLSAAEWRNHRSQRQAIYSVAQRGFSPSRHAFVPAAANLAGLTLLTSEPYFDCLSHHKYHSYLLLQAAGLRIPRTWIFDAKAGWANSREPHSDLLTIAKPNLESASVGVDQDSVFRFRDKEMPRLLRLADDLRQSILIQEFISGWEVEVLFSPVSQCSPWTRLVSRSTNALKWAIISYTMQRRMMARTSFSTLGNLSRIFRSNFASRQPMPFKS